MQEIIVWTRKNPTESLSKIEKDHLIESKEIMASLIREMSEVFLEEMIEDSIKEMIENTIGEMIGNSISNREDQKILDLEQSSVVNVEPVNSGLSHELEDIAVITHIYPLKL